MVQLNHRSGWINQQPTFHVCPICCILPPHILEALLQNGNDQQQTFAFETLRLSEQFRGRREVVGNVTFMASPGQKRRTVFDAKNDTELPGTLVRGEGDPATGDAAVDEAYDGSGATYDFYSEVFERNSIDDRGLRLDSTVHYSQQYDNAFWNGSQMVYGDGDGQLFERFTKSLDVIAHELTHGVTQYEANLQYQGQSGALNESFSDVFGILVKQYILKQTATESDWIIGSGLFTPNVQGVGIRSMKEPGTAYNDPVLGRDPQPGHVDNLYTGTADNGGVHINSGIPNRAFYLAAIALGGNAWERAGKIWYITLRDRLRSRSTFRRAAQTTVTVAGELYGEESVEQQAVRTAWQTVGVLAS